MDSSDAASAGSGDNSPPRWRDDQAIELWKYFGGVGAQDKTTMVTVGFLLLGFSATLMGILIDKDLLKFWPLSIGELGKAISFAILGIVISCVAISYDPHHQHGGESGRLLRGRTMHHLDAMDHGSEQGSEIGYDLLACPAEVNSCLRAAGQHPDVGKP